MMWKFKKIYHFFNAIIFLLAVGGLVFLKIGNWLSFSETPCNADLIICLTGSNERVQKAIDLSRQGYAEKILVTSVQIPSLMGKNRVPAENIMILSSKAASTYEEARLVSQFINEKKYNSAIIVSDPYHMYRVKWTFGQVLNSQKIHTTFTASEPSWAKGSWWENKTSRVFVLNEIPKVLYYWIAHGLLGIKNDPPWVNDLESWYNKMLVKLV